MRSRDLRLMETIIQDAQMGDRENGYYPVTLTTNQSDYVHCHYYPVENAKLGVIFVGGVGGGWDTPAYGLYPSLCEELQHHKITALRVRYRYPTAIEEAVRDAIAGISYLQNEGIEAIALVGHSFGGAVVIRAAASAEAVRTVVTLASQSYGANLVPQLATRCSILLLHGTADPVLPPDCSQQIYQAALEPKQIILYPNAGHGLDEFAAEVHQVVRDWLIEKLNQAIASPL